MAGGGKVRIADRDNFGELARVENGRLLVSGIGGGGGGGDVNIVEYGGVAVGPANPIDVSVAQPVSVDDNGGSLTVDGAVVVTSVGGIVDVSGSTVTVTQPVSVDDNGGSLTVDGSVAVSSVAGIVNVSGSTVTIQEPIEVDQATHASLNATVRVQDGNGADLLDVIANGEVGPDPGTKGDVKGLAPVAYASSNPSATSDTWSSLFMTKQGELLVASIVTGVVPGTGATSLGKAEDDAHASGDTGVMALGVRNDTPSSLAGTDGDYVPPTFNSIGALWVALAGMETTETRALSGSTRGRPIAIAATATPGTTLHTATTTAGEIDKVWIWLTNTSSAEQLVTIEFGSTGVGNEIDILIPANESVLAVDGAVIGGAATDTIAAYAGTASVINATGRVERITQP